MYKIKTLLLIVLIVSIPLLFSCEDTGANPQTPDGEKEESTQDSSQDDNNF
ncbi:MAG: hypothetical protein JEZ04_13475 [Spirochaetales bacterium]|nr:hypothetical protein [Spirochaetales bacterium]